MSHSIYLNILLYIYTCTMINTQYLYITKKLKVIINYQSIEFYF